MNPISRRGFLGLLGSAIGSAAVVPTKTYAFFGGILRPKPVLDWWDLGEITEVPKPQYLGIVKVSRDGAYHIMARGVGDILKVHLNDSLIAFNVARADGVYLPNLNVQQIIRLKAGDVITIGPDSGLTEMNIMELGIGEI